MTFSFELFVARRYLRAKRKQAVISVITIISVIGVAAGVMALVIALAINNGFRGTLQKNLLSATAHVSIIEKEPSTGIDHWEDLAARLKRLPGVTSAIPVLYNQVYMKGPIQGRAPILKGIPVDGALAPPDILRHLNAGSLDGLRPSGGLPGIILGSGLAQQLGMRLNSHVVVFTSPNTLTPAGLLDLSRFRFKVVGIFESGFFDLDSTWAFTSLASAQRILDLKDVVNDIELKLTDLNRAPEVAEASKAIIGPTLMATTWLEQNHGILSAFRMEKVVTIVTIGLIQLVAALNILIALIMMVMEKNRDIAILLSMGCRREQIRKIFMMEGLLIGVTGTSIGLVLGYTLCFFADHYRWLRLDEEVYSLSFVPFESHWMEGAIVALAAILVSFLATLYPARNATRIAPAEALRYE